MSVSLFCGRLQYFSLWSNRWASFCHSYLHRRQVLLKGAAVDCLCKRVSGVIFSWHSLEPKVAAPRLGLHPKISHRQVADPANARPAADANGRGGVGKDRKRCAYAKVPGDGLDPKPFTGVMISSPCTETDLRIELFGPQPTRWEIVLYFRKVARQVLARRSFETER